MLYFQPIRHKRTVAACEAFFALASYLLLILAVSSDLNTCSSNFKFELRDA